MEILSSSLSFVPFISFCIPVHREISHIKELFEALIVLKGDGVEQEGKHDVIQSVKSLSYIKIISI